MAVLGERKARMGVSDQGFRKRGATTVGMANNQGSENSVKLEQKSTQRDAGAKHPGPRGM